MENYERESSFIIELPTEGDELHLARMHIQAWKESYVLPESGLTEEKIDELHSHWLTDTDFRKKTILEALENPQKVLYRVVRNTDEQIVGFLHGTKHEERNELDAIYLLNEAKGTGTGRKLMGEFFAWIDQEKPSRLEVFSFNHSAIEFYEKFGFVKTSTELELYRGFLKVTEMIRLADIEAESSFVKKF